MTPHPRPVPGSAVHGHRVRAQRGRTAEAASTEFDPDSAEPVIATMAEQQAFVEGAGPRRHHASGPVPREPGRGHRRAGDVRVGPGRGAAPPPLRGQQRLPRQARGGRPGVLRPLARSQPGRVRRAAGSGAPYYVATQAHPELRSRPTRPHPLFAGLIAAALARSKAASVGARAVASASTSQTSLRSRLLPLRPSWSAAGWSPC